MRGRERGRERVREKETARREGVMYIGKERSREVERE